MGDFSFGKLNKGRQGLEGFFPSPQMFMIREESLMPTNSWNSCLGDCELAIILRAVIYRKMKTKRLLMTIEREIAPLDVTGNYLQHI